MLRKKVAETPIKILQNRNNVDTTIFQSGYHYSNAKRKRGLSEWTHPLNTIHRNMQISIN